MAMPERQLATIEQTQMTEYVPAVTVTLEQAKQNFQRLHQVTKELMRQGVDYDTIPGTPKPTLLKPGAEHLLQFFGLGHKVIRVEAKEDWESGFFYYCYRVTIFKARPMPDGTIYEQVIAECEGSANSKERRYRNQDVYTIVNTLQKMAIKRALVGATLQATGTSGMFTQDLEDGAIDTPEMHRTNKLAKDERRPTEAQLKRLYAISKEAGADADSMKKLIHDMFGKESSKELTINEYNELCDMLLEAKKSEEKEAQDQDIAAE